MKRIAFSAIATLAAVLFTGCADKGKKVSFEEYSYSSSEAVCSVSVEVRDREIEIMPSGDDKVYIDGFDSEAERYKVSVSDGELKFTIVNNKEWSDYVGVKAGADVRKVTLKVPDGTLNSLSVSATNEDIILGKINIGSVKLDCNGGDISLDRLNAESAVTLNGKNGDICGTIVGSYDDYSVSCGIKKGKSNLPDEKTGGSKKLTVSMNNGDVDVDFVK